MRTVLRVNHANRANNANQANDAARLVMSRGRKRGGIMNIDKRNIDRQWQPQAGSTILAQGVEASYDEYTSGLNDNVLVVGGSGTGKTRGVVRPNLLQATGSYIVSDPKGNLYDQYARYLLARGYRVERLDFVHPERSTVHYNLFSYLENETDALRVAHMMTDAKAAGNHSDMFWEYSSELLLMALISYIHESMRPSHWNMAELNELLRLASRRNDASAASLDRKMKAFKEAHPDSLGARCYESVSTSPDRTWDCIVVTAAAKYAPYDTKELRELMKTDTVNLREIGDRETALFVVVSDTDRSMDVLANLFFSQAMQVLCRVADATPESRLKVPVRFILDDFATNVCIDEFPRMISSIRSRGISAMLMIQAESQLESRYGQDAATIISNCDTYLYLGGNDITTAMNVGRRCDLPMLDILGMQPHECLVFRRGQNPVRTRTFDLVPFEESRMTEVQALMDISNIKVSIGEKQRRREEVAAMKRRKRMEASRSGLPVAYVRDRQFAG